MNDMIEAHSDIDGLSYAAMQQMMLFEAHEHGLTVLENSDATLMVQSPFGRFGISARENGLRLYVQSQERDQLIVLRDSLVEHIAHALPDIAETIRWSDAPQAGALPPNFQITTVKSVEELCTDFLRVTVVAQGDFGEGGLHFRMLLPPDDSPQWPRLQDNGSVRWPTGDKALHKPVYTVRSFSPGEMVFDVFRHQGGQVTQWVENAKPGDALAILGPGGEGVLQQQELILCGDETAYPAMMRMLKALPDGARVQVLAHSTTGARDYPFDLPEGVAFSWIGDEFVARAAALFDATPGAYIWAAAENEQIRTLRARLNGREKGHSTLTAYWHKSATTG